MNKPQMKRQVVVDVASIFLRIILFYSTEDAVTEFYPFGLIEPDANIPNLYRLTVDARYDFDEVVAYIDNYGME